MSKQSNKGKGRITRIDRAWDAALREAVTRDAAAAVAHAEEQIESEETQAFVGAAASSECIEEDRQDEDEERAYPVAFPRRFGQHIEAEEVPEPEGSMRLPLKYLSAALLCTARYEYARKYLEGVYIHVIDGDLRIVSTDGHRMFACRQALEPGSAPEWAQAGVILPAEKVRQVLPLLRRAAAFHGIRLRMDPASRRLILESADGFASFALTPIEAQFPDYAKVLAQAAVNFARGEGEPMQTTAMQTAYLKGAADIAEKVGARAVHTFVSTTEKAATFFTFEGAPDVAYIVSPMTSNEPAVSDGVIKLVGPDGIRTSLAAYRAHLTRTQKALKDASNDRERERLEQRRDGLKVRIDHLLGITGKQIEHKAAA